MVELIMRRRNVDVELTLALFGAAIAVIARFV
jgi:hypothetical protein